MSIIPDIILLLVSNTGQYNTISVLHCSKLMARDNKMKMYPQIYLCVKAYHAEHEGFVRDKMSRKNNECIDISVSRHRSMELGKLEWSAK